MNIYSVYAYIDEIYKVVYVGLTKDKKRRKREHKNCRRRTTVFKYFFEKYNDIPEPVYLNDGLTDVDAQYYEDYWINQYRDDGYIILNKGKTGVDIGSLGNNEKKLTREFVFEESMKYKTLKDFRKYSSSCYNEAKNKHWVKEMYWLDHKTFWDKESVFEESKKYNTKIDFQRNSPTAYDLSLKNDWLCEMIWLIPQRKTWDIDSVIEESKKYKNKTSFRYGCCGAYKFAVRNKILNDLYK